MPGVGSCRGWGWEAARARGARAGSGGLFRPPLVSCAIWPRPTRPLPARGGIRDRGASVSAYVSSRRAQLPLVLALAPELPACSDPSRPHFQYTNRLLCVRAGLVPWPPQSSVVKALRHKSVQEDLWVRWQDHAPCRA